jgi:hypothetical protein
VTKADQKRLDIIHRLPCMACVQIGANITPVEANHIVDKGYRRLSGGHQATIPLCEWHHRAAFRLGMTAKEMTNIFGPSLARSKRAFVKRFGNERELLANIDKVING